MRAEDLNHDELVQIHPTDGEILFAGQRAVLLDAVAIGILRRYLMDNFGYAATRTILTEFGFAHGWRLAGALQSEFDWQDLDEWRRAGPRILELGGLFRAMSGCGDPLHQGGAVFASSYEAEQHLLHFGRSDAPVCWTLCGQMSGYLSRTTGLEIYVLEDRCSAEGHAACEFQGRTKEEWGEDRAADLSPFRRNNLEDCLAVSLSRVTQSIREAEEKIHEQRKLIVHVVPEIDAPSGIVCKSPEMLRVVELSRRAAKVDVTILVTGESGVGKERITRLVHNESARAKGPFIAVNCAAISESLFESELFGHKRGSFTGAEADRPGLFEAASGGSLVLDEVGEIPPTTQAKLLRVLQEREVRRVGENLSRKIDVRVIAATNSDLEKRVAAGTFREDLYYRLKVVEIHVPTLRQRASDLLPLARLFLVQAAARLGREDMSLSPRAADQLLHYDWPGNVRELENAMERATALAATSRVEVEDLPEEIRTPFLTPTLGENPVRPLAEIELDYIQAVLRRNGGNKSRTAEELHIGQSTLYRKLKSCRHVPAHRVL